MTVHRHGAGVPGSSWLTAALLFTMFFVTMISPVVGASNISAVSVHPSVANASAVPLLPFGTAEAAVPVVFPNDGGEGVFIDPNCDPKLVLRQLGEDDEKPDCPCCYSRDGGHLMPYQTPDLATRTALPTVSWTAEHSLWQATATIPGEPVPTDDSDVIEFEVCANCPDGRCMLAKPDRRRQADEEDDDDEFSSFPDSDEDELDFSEEEEQDPTTATDILKGDLTHPAVWQYGEVSWWGHMYSLVVNRGARFGPSVPSDKTDPKLFLSGKQLSHASMIRFDKKGDDGKLARVDEGLAGGIIPIYGCTGVVVATDRGVYTAHIWEAPTFMTAPGRTKEDDTVRKLHWDLGVNQFFASGNKNILSPPSPALADLVKEDGPLNKYAWMQVHLFGVKDHQQPDRLLYDEKIKDLEKELQKYLGDVPDKNFYRHIYDRNPPRGDDGTVFNSNEYYRERAGHQLVAWQYAPKEAIAKPGSEKLEEMRAFRLWFNKKVVTTHRWCDEDAKDCSEVCGKERPEKDPKRTTQVGGMGKPETPASGSGSKPKDPATGDKPKDPSSGDKPKEPGSEAKPEGSGGGSQIRDIGPAAHRSLIPRVPRANPRLPPEFHDMFPDKLNDPGTWPYGSLDWWRRMYTVAVRYGATGEPRELLNIVSGDDYEPNHCVYRDLPNLGRTGTGGGVTPLYGCTGVVVASNKGVYMAHFWERPNFMPAPHMHQQRKPDLYGNEEALWDRRVNGMLRNGWKPYFEDAPWGPSLEELTGTTFNSQDVEWLQVWILHPDRSKTELTGEALYATKIGWLKTELRRILPITDDNIEMVTYMKYSTESPSIVGSDRYYANNPGIHMFVWQFAPNAPARQATPNFRNVNAVRVFWDRREIWYHEWCPAGKDCSVPPQVHCEQRVTARPSKREALALRQDPATTQTTDPPPTATDNATEAPTELPYRQFFLQRLTSPNEPGTDTELWWKKMYDMVAIYGAGMHEVAISPDDFYADHASYNNFTVVPSASGITPMWGCTGIVVMSDQGVYTARIWEVPGFIIPYQAENPYTYAYDEEATWQRRIVKLFTDGINMQYPERSSPSLAGLANGTMPFSPNGREWIHVQIITPKAHGNGTEDRPLYFKKVAKLRELLVSILDIEKEDVKIKTYSARKETKTQAINGTNDVFLEAAERHEDRPGANLLGIQYAPAHKLHANTSNETSVRAVRMWWDREEYFTLFWCAPYAFADFPPNSNVTSDISCIRMDTEPEKESKDEVCMVTFMPGLYPYDNMRAELFVGFSRWDVVDGKVGKFLHYESSHNVSTRMGSLLTISSGESGLPQDFSVHMGQSWDEWLWRMGYACHCDEDSCGLFSPSCCWDDSCLDYACNCAEPDDGDDLCWPGQNHVATCCLERKGCLDEELIEQENAPDMPWNKFEHGFTYGNETWSTGSTRDVREAEYPPVKPFCATGEDDVAGYNNLSLFGEKELLWEQAFQCYFACGESTDKDGPEGEWEGRNITMQFLPSVPLADDEPDLYEDLQEPLYNPDQRMSEGATWTTGVGPVPMGLFQM